jgi:hypothetical protein
MSRSILALGSVLAVLTSSSLGSLGAAELQTPPPSVRAATARDCGPCGCLSVTYVYHRELRSTYGLDFDPRNYDQTEPHYYFGGMRAYPRYFVDGQPIPGSC